jgi:hypothetical protein
VLPQAGISLMRLLPMHVYRQTLLLFTIVLATLPALAQEAFTLDAAAQYARTHHPALQAAREDVTAATANLRGAKAPRNPEIIITPGVLGPAGSDEFLSIPRRWRSMGRGRRAPKPPPGNCRRRMPTGA